MLAAENGNQLVAALIEALHQIAGHAEVGRAVHLSGEQVHIAGLQHGAFK
jgi:UDP-3-O-[3-hydroxymyristoyl] glucosamine N-acyltransferase